jgi:hypothetical protein
MEDRVKFEYIIVGWGITFFLWGLGFGLKVSEHPIWHIPIILGWVFCFVMRGIIFVNFESLEIRVWKKWVY